MSRYFDKYRIVLVGLLLLLVACSGNRLVITALYDGIDSKMAKRFYQYAEFNDKQLSAIKSTSEAYHLWHRKLQLPQYVRLLDDIHRRISMGDEISMQQVKQWSDSVYGFRDQLFACSPINYSSEFLRTLNDSQVVQFEDRFDTLEKLKASEESRLSVEEIVQQKWNKSIKTFKRAGLRLNQQQQDLLKQTLTENNSLDEAWDAHWKKWKIDFIDMLSERDKADFDEKNTHHFMRLWRTMQYDHADTIQANRQAWNVFVYRLIASLSDKQKKEFLSVLANLIETLNKLSQSSHATIHSKYFQTPDSCRVS